VFGVVAIVQERAGDDRLSDFAGLAKREPIVSLCMMVFLLSLAGIPPLAGFFGKFYIFSTAISVGSNNLGLLWLVIFAIAMSVVSLYYYLKVLKQIYVVELPVETVFQKASWPIKIVLILLALAVVILGAAPDLLVAPLLAAIRSVAL
jgi:NADH-quinone oxidoreductase subunit N